MTYGELFAGVGMAGHGFDKAGWSGKWFVEIEDYSHEVYKRNFSNSKGYYDVKDCGAHNLEPVDVIFGGFPCQDLSVAGKQGGIHSERSGLFFEFARIVGELRPRWWLLENVPALISGDDGRWFSAVLNEMAKIGYDVQWHCIPACALGAPHRRDRIWIIARRQNVDVTKTSRRGMGNSENFGATDREINSTWYSSQALAHAPSEQADRQGQSGFQPESAQSGQDVSDSRGTQPRGISGVKREAISATRSAGQTISDTAEQRPHNETDERIVERKGGDKLLSVKPRNNGNGQSQPRLGGSISHGLTPWMDEPVELPRLTTEKENRTNRLKALGNGLMWQIPYIIAEGINQIERTEFENNSK